MDFIGEGQGLILFVSDWPGSTPIKSTKKKEKKFLTIPTRIFNLKLSVVPNILDNSPSRSRLLVQRIYRRIIAFPVHFRPIILL